ncbi:MAG: DNA polymerase III subunit delta, partial [Acidobacteria bacterium]|nr:DNA polymerase III subunit delta [Acidobacteriota bacterium]
MAPVYFLLGEEVLLREEFVSRLLTTLLPPGMETLNLDVLSGGEATSADIASRCRTIPAFAPRRLVLLKEAHRLRSEVWDATLAYLDAPSPTTCLICVADKLEHGHRGLKRIEEVGKVLR